MNSYEETLLEVISKEKEHSDVFDALSDDVNTSDNISALLNNYRDFVKNQRSLDSLENELGLDSSNGIRSQISLIEKKMDNNLMGKLKPYFRDLESTVGEFFETKNGSDHYVVLERMKIFKQKSIEMNFFDYFQYDIENYFNRYKKAAEIAFRIAEVEMSAEQNIQIIGNSVNNVSDYLSQLARENAKKEMNYAIDLARTSTILGGVMLAVILGALMLNVRRTVTKSLRITISVLDEIGAGKLAKRLQFNRKRNDEFDAMAIAVNKMADELIGIVSQVLSSGKELNRSGGFLHESIKTISQTTDNATEQTTFAATATKQISNTLQDVACNSKLTRIAAEESCKIAAEGTKTIDRVVSSILDTETMFSRVDQSVDELSRRSRKVETITFMINDIASQTNLLALNAAIEAARAGEAGRGFSVVADEVRGLAIKTVAATSDIGKIVKNMGTEINSLSEIMKEAMESVKIGRRYVEEAMESVEVVASKISEVTEQNIQVAQGIDEMAQVTLEISGNMDSISQAMTQTRAGMTDIKTKSSVVSEKAVELMLSSDRFAIS